jgi:hypothetical protein
VDKILGIIVDKLWELLWPKIEAKFDEWLPKVMKAALVGAVKGGGEIVVDGTDRVTNIIPGEMDDAIVDPLVRQGMDFLNSILGRQ